MVTGFLLYIRSIITEFRFQERSPTPCIIYKNILTDTINDLSHVFQYLFNSRTQCLYKLTQKIEGNIKFGINILNTNTTETRTRATRGSGDHSSNGYWLSK